jgi:hypothetical protein
MSDQSKSENSFWMTLPVIPPNFADLWQMPMTVFLEEQTELLDESRKMAAAWMKRRQEAMETGMQTFAAILGCRDPGAMAAICSEWVAGSMSRLMADINDARDQGIRLAEIGQKSAAALSRQRANMAAASKPASTPGRERVRVKGASQGEAAAEAREHSAAE